MLDDEKVILTKDGRSFEYDVLFSFDCDNNAKTYVGYSDHSKDENGNENIYVGRFNTLDSDVLEELEEPQEWDMVNDVIENIKSNGVEYDK